MMREILAELEKNYFTAKTQRLHRRDGPPGRLYNVAVLVWLRPTAASFRIPPLARTIFILGFAFLAGCGKEQPQTVQAPTDPVLLERKEKDRSFKSGPESPLREEDKPKFHGLAYYDPDPASRFKVTLHRYPSPETIRVATNTDEIRQALRYGYFEFDVQGQKCRLQVYRMLDDNETEGARLFMPFRDATSGKETYGGGRYIDLKENTSGIYELDFNRAYNPFCAYGRDYSCPLPPRENTLPVPIYAGEKNLPLHTEGPGVKG